MEVALATRSAAQSALQALLCRLDAVACTQSSNLDVDMAGITNAPTWPSTGRLGCAEACLEVASPFIVTLITKACASNSTEACMNSINKDHFKRNDPVLHQGAAQ
jgi:hypothetical protein